MSNAPSIKRICTAGNEWAYGKEWRWLDIINWVWQKKTPVPQEPSSLPWTNSRIRPLTLPVIKNSIIVDIASNSLQPSNTSFCSKYWSLRLFKIPHVDQVPRNTTSPSFCTFPQIWHAAKLSLPPLSPWPMGFCVRLLFLQTRPHRRVAATYAKPNE